MKKYLITLSAMIILFTTACKKDNAVTIDTEYPEIHLTSEDAFPKQCAVVKRGETFTFRAVLQDNAELGSVSIDIHHNFDQHTHSTEVESCDFEAIKAPVKPFLLIQSYPIPTGLKAFEVEQEITIPADVDPGDYHFLIRLTDKEGWQTMKGLSIKVH